MVNPYGLETFDLGRVLGTAQNLRAGRLQLLTGEREAQRQQNLLDIYGRHFGGQQPAGEKGAPAPPVPAAGTQPAAASSAQPSAGGATPQQSTVDTQSLFQELAAVEGPQKAAEAVHALGQMTADQRAASLSRLQAAAPLYASAAQMPYDRRRAYIASVRPQLEQLGMAPAEIDAFDPTDENLNAHMSLGMTMAQALERGQINWQIIPQVGAFATDNQRRPLAPGDPRLSPAQPGAPAPAPVSGQSAVPANIPQGSPLTPPAAQPSADSSQIFQRMIGAESNGQQFGANGQPLTSPAGAIGIAQVMPTTAPEAARLAGVPFDENRYRTDPQYNRALGEAYFQEQLRTFGDPAMAVAAYNAGPQRVRQAVERGGENWQAHIPAETRAYVQNVMGGGDGGGGQAAPPPPSLQDQARTGVIMAPRQLPQGFEAAPNGGIQPMRGSQPEYERQQGAQSNERQDRNVVSGIRQEFNQLPEVRNFTTIRQAMLQIRRLADSVPQTSPERAQADMALIFSFMKALDPTSAVRETEYANAQNSAGVPDRVRNLYNRTLTGASLNPNQRHGMVSSAYQAYLASAETYNQRARQYHEILKEAGVSNPGQQIMLATGPATEARNRRTQQQRQGRTSQGVRWRRVD